MKHHPSHPPAPVSPIGSADSALRGRRGDMPGRALRSAPGDRPAPRCDAGPGTRRAALGRLARLTQVAGLAGWAAALGTLPAAPAARAHTSNLGPVEPRRPAPALALTLHTGERRGLHALLQGRVTALQLMFTGCSAVCPLQGAVFAALQQQLTPGPAQAQLLSVSIDPLSDDAAALAAWRRRFGAGERWLAGAPPVAQPDWLLEFVEGRRSGPDRHSAQTFLFDVQGRLAYRLAELAKPGDIAEAVRTLARRG